MNWIQSNATLCISYICDLFSAPQGHTQVRFMSTLLQVTMSEQLDLPVRQAGTVMAL